MLSAILGIFTQSWFGQIVSQLLSWWNARQATKAQASADMQQDVAAHQTDGQKSVTLADSANAQNQELAIEDAQSDSQVIQPTTKGTP